MKTTLSDEESHEEHGTTLYSSLGYTTAKLLAFLCSSVVKTQEKEWKLEKKAFWTIMKKTTFLPHFVD